MTSSNQIPTPATTPAPKAPAKPVAAPSVQNPPPGKVGLPSRGLKAPPKPAAKPKSETKLAEQKPVVTTVDFGFLGSITLKDAAAHIGSQTGYAFAITIGALIGIEWLMPGSVLPFINVISLLPWAFIIVVALIAFKGRRQGFLNTLNILVGVIITVALLASMLTNMPIYGLRTILLSGSVILIITVWAISMYTEH